MGERAPETYRRVQRALIRVRQIQRPKEKTEGKSEPEPHREPSCMPTSPKSRSRTSPLSPTRSPRPSATRTTAGYGADPTGLVSKNPVTKVETLLLFCKKDLRLIKEKQSGGQLTIGDAGRRS